MLKTTVYRGPIAREAMKGRDRLVQCVSILGSTKRPTSSSWITMAAAILRRRRSIMQAGRWRMPVREQIAAQGLLFAFCLWKAAAAGAKMVLPSPLYNQPRSCLSSLEWCNSHSNQAGKIDWKIQYCIKNYSSNSVKVLWYWTRASRVRGVIFSPNAVFFDPRLVKSMDAKPADRAGPLYLSKFKSPIHFSHMTTLGAL